jgi:integrase
VKSGARAVGKDPKRFGTHSLRAGGATNMYRAGVDALTIQFHGRWASDAFKLYTRLCRESVAGVAAKIVDGPRATTVLQ